MDFFTFLWLMSLTVLLPAVIIKLTLDYKRHRLEMGVPEYEQGQGLTIGELKNLLRETVSEATRPIEARLRALEQHQLPEAQQPPALPEITRREPTNASDDD